MTDPLKTKLRNVCLAVLIVVDCAGLILAYEMGLLHGVIGQARLYDYNWSHYLKPFGLQTGDHTYDVIQKLGEPKRIEEDNGDYTTLYYDGFSVGFFGPFTRQKTDSIDTPVVCAIFIEDSTYKIFRKQIGVGSKLSDMKFAYYDATIMTGENHTPCGFILHKYRRPCHEGIWIYYETDGNGIITKLTVANGF